MTLLPHSHDSHDAAYGTDYYRWPRRADGTRGGLADDGAAGAASLLCAPEVATAATSAAVSSSAPCAAAQMFV